jgi:hypothetical protein
MKSSLNVLKYGAERRSADTIRRAYLKWRAQQDPPLPERCDNPDCVFHTDPLVWSGKVLKLVLDHQNGVNSDNRPKNLRLLCPNCDAQLPTRGGGNKGRVEKSGGGFALVREDGKRHYTLPAEPGVYTLTGHSSKVGPAED